MLLAAIVAAAAISTARGIEFRRSIPIRTPQTLEVEYVEEVRGACVPAPCEDLQPLEQPVAVRRSTVRAALKQLEESWNGAQLEAQIADTFFDKSRLLDTLREVVPRDARLRVLAIQNVQVLAQFLRPRRGSVPRQRLSVVSTRVSTQVQFTDPQDGFVRSRRSTQEYVLVLTEQG